MKFLIIGGPYSGTTYIRTVFKKAGYNIGSEFKDGADGRVTYLYGAGSGKEYRNYRPILHQIRNPVEFVKSVSLSTDIIMNYLINSCKYSCDTYDFLDNIQKNNIRDLKTLCLIWYFWNESCEQRAVFSYRIEDLPNVLDKFNQFLPVDIYQKHLDLVSKKNNTKAMNKGYRNYSLNQIKEACGNFFPLFKNKAEFYGYEISI